MNSRDLLRALPLRLAFVVLEETTNAAAVIMARSCLLFQEARKANDKELRSQAARGRFQQAVKKDTEWLQGHGIEAP